MKSLRPKGYFREYSQYLSNLLSNLDYDAIEKVARLILERSRQGKTLFLIGNGGSAATASHFANDFSHGALLKEKPLIRAISLADNQSLITAIGNDDGYEKVFSVQIRNLFQDGDMLVAISASGNSPNILKAVELAKEKSGVVVGLVGFDGGKLAEICDYAIHVKTEKGKYGPVEDIHLVLCHMISSYLALKLRPF